MLEDFRPDALITYLSAYSDTLSQVAAAYARRSGIPLTTLVHDDCDVIPHKQPHLRKHRFRWVLEASRQNWFVSPELAQAYGFNGNEHEVLPPIPEGLQVEVPNRVPSRPLRAVYAGYAHDAQALELARLAKWFAARDVKLTVLAAKTALLEKLAADGELDWRPLIPGNREALHWLRENADFLLVSYPPDTSQQPWVRSSFPSKFVEYLHLALPVLVTAPEDSAIWRWCQRHGWTSVFHPLDEVSIEGFLRDIGDEIGWRRRCAESLRFARQHFNAESIHARLEDNLSLK